jgi:hypothetical protein
MNWLLYIGGGIIWEFLNFVIIVQFFEKEAIRNKETRIMVGSIVSILLLGSLLIWIWICLRLIRIG